MNSCELAAHSGTRTDCSLTPRSPTHDDAEVFRAALASDDLDRHILGARGLLALGRLNEGDPERATAALKTIREFLAYVESIDRDHGAVRTSHWDELIEDAATATVVGHRRSTRLRIG
jgi:hypothetical protein